MDFDVLYLRVLRFLNFRPRSEKEVREYLKNILKLNVSNMSDRIVAKLKQQKFLNDEEFAKWLVRSRTEFKPKGERFIRLELQQKGIDKRIIDTVLSDGESKTKSDRELAIEVLITKKKKFVSLEPKKRFLRAGSMLARRGFDLDTIRAAIDEVFGKMV